MAEKCTICLEEVSDSIASLDVCAHIFHFSCIQDWSKISNTCPLCKGRFKRIKKQASPGKKRGRTVRVRRVDQKYEENEEEDLDAALNFVDQHFDTDEDDDDWVDNSAEPDVFDEGDVCQVCGGADEAAVLMLCDLCNNGYHTYCLIPPLDSVPLGSWFCGPCVQEQAGILNNPLSQESTSSRGRGRRGRGRGRGRARGASRRSSRGRRRSTSRRRGTSRRSGIRAPTRSRTTNSRRSRRVTLSVGLSDSDSDFEDANEDSDYSSASLEDNSDNSSDVPLSLIRTRSSVSSNSSSSSRPANSSSSSSRARGRGSRGGRRGSSSRRRGSRRGRGAGRRGGRGRGRSSRAGRRGRDGPRRGGLAGARRAGSNSSPEKEEVKMTEEEKARVDEAEKRKSNEATKRQTGFFGRVLQQYRSNVQQNDPTRVTDDLDDEFERLLGNTASRAYNNPTNGSTSSSPLNYSTSSSPLNYSTSSSSSPPFPRIGNISSRPLIEQNEVSPQKEEVPFALSQPPKDANNTPPETPDSPKDKPWTHPRFLELPPISSYSEAFPEKEKASSLPTSATTGKDETPKSQTKRKRKHRSKSPSGNGKKKSRTSDAPSLHNSPTTRIPSPGGGGYSSGDFMDFDLMPEIDFHYSPPPSPRSQVKQNLAGDFDKTVSPQSNPNPNASSSSSSANAPLSKHNQASEFAEPPKLFLSQNPISHSKHNTQLKPAPLPPAQLDQRNSSQNSQRNSPLSGASKKQTVACSPTPAHSSNSDTLVQQTMSIGPVQSPGFVPSTPVSSIPEQRMSTFKISHLPQEKSARPGNLEKETVVFDSGSGRSHSRSPAVHQRSPYLKDERNEKMETGSLATQTPATIFTTPPRMRGKRKRSNSSNLVQVVYETPERTSVSPRTSGMSADRESSRKSVDRQMKGRISRFVKGQIHQTPIKDDKEKFKKIAKKSTEKVYEHWKKKRRENPDLSPEAFLDNKRVKAVCDLVQKYVERADGTSKND